MITVEQRAEIRRLFFAEHWRIGTIAQHLGVHRDTVNAAIEVQRFRHPGNVIKETKLTPYREFITQTLERYPRLRATRFHEMLRQRGYTGSARSVRRFLKRVRPAPKEAFLRLSTLPGEQAQVDWACFGKVRVGNALRNLSCFVMVLAWCRALFARFFLDQTLPSFLSGHVQAFDHFGGVPRVILYDNLKSAVLERLGEHIRFHPALVELAGHYHFAPQPCAPYRANEKGRVERAILYLRESFYAARSFKDVDDLNVQLEHWLAEVADARPVPNDPTRRSVREAFTEEKARLLTLPEHPFCCELVTPARSGKTPYVRFDLNDYSIPHTLVGMPLTLCASQTAVRIVDGDKEVARHARSYDRGQRIEKPEHLQALGEAKRHAQPLRGRERLLAACPHAAAVIEGLVRRNEPLGAHVTALLRLLDTHGAMAVDAALETAASRGSFSSHAVAHILEQTRRAAATPPPVAVVLPNNPDVRNLTVTPHDLRSYDVLCTDEEGEE